MNLRNSERLQGKPVGDHKRHNIFLEQRSAQNGITDNSFEGLDAFDLVVQVLLQELLQTGQFEAVASTNDLGDFRFAVDAVEVANLTVDR